MTSIEQVENRLNAFLRQTEPGVIAIKGSWGVGKTHLWNQYITERLERREYIQGCRAYTYASLFSVADVGQLKRSLFSRQQALGPPYIHWETRMRGWLGKVLRFVQLNASPVVGVGIKNTDLWAEVVEDRSLREMLVCIDDLDRKPPSLPTTTLLGLIANLREERQCKVVLLYNDDQLNKDHATRETIAEHREKVIDFEIKLKPTVRECYDLVFNDASVQFDARGEYKPHPFYTFEPRSLLELLESMELSNIRVMQKIRSALEYLRSGVMERHPRTWANISRQAVKICWLHYCHGHSFPLDDVLDQQRWTQILIAKQGDKSEAKTSDKYSPVSQVNFHPDTIDVLVTEYLRTGFVDWEKHAPFLDKEEADILRDEIAAKYNTMFDLVFSNFQASADAVRTTITEFVAAHRDELKVQQLYQMKLLLADVGSTEAVDVLLEAKVDAFVAANAHSDLSDLHMHGLNSDLASKIREKWKATPVRKPIAEAIEMLAGSDSWNSHDLRYLGSYTEADYLQWLQNDASLNLLYRIKTFRQRFANDELGRRIILKLDSALLKMAKRSDLDRKRVFGSAGVPEPSGGAESPANVTPPDGAPQEQLSSSPATQDQPEHPSSPISSPPIK